MTFSSELQKWTIPGGTILSAPLAAADAELRKELEALLAAADKTLGWLKKPVDNAARWVLSRFAVLELDIGNYLAAETKAERALTNERTRVGSDTAPSIAMTMVTLAEARLFQGDATSAETVLRRAVEILRGKLPANYPAVTTAEVRLGEALTAAGRASGAEPILREALASAHNPPFRIPVWQVGEAESALG